MSFDQLFDGSDAHLLPSGAAECAEYLRKFNEWRRGADTDAPYPPELGMNLEFASEVLDAIAGHDHLMVIAATRYCLGRMTYIVSDCAAWLVKIWPLLNDKTKAIIQRDIEEAFARDDDDRAEGRDHKALGHDCDRAEWEKVRRLWSGNHFRDAEQMIETSAPAIVFYPAGSLGEAVETEGGAE